MRAFAVLVAALLVVGCEKEKEDDFLAHLPYGKWVHFENKDVLTDVKSKSSVLKSGPLSDGSMAPAEMHFRCSAGKMDFYLSWNRYVGSTHSVDSRIDSDPHGANKWQASADGKSSFYPFLNSVFLDRLSASKSYIARVSTSNGVITAKFDTSQVMKETKDIREECKI